MLLIEKIKETAKFLAESGVDSPEFGLILGSGLGELANEITNSVIIEYSCIPHWCCSTVVGHAGKLVYGEILGRKVLSMQGRSHFYESNSMSVVTFPVRVMAALGCTGMIVTNAAGGISCTPGTLMLISDHINLMGQNPLIGDNLEEFGPRFPDMSNAYTKTYREIARSVSKSLNIPISEGVYIGVTGPSYETPAEIRAFRSLGVAAVGMSTVPEVIVGVHSGLKVLGVSVITNFAAGLQSELNHEEVVIQMTDRTQENFKRLIKNILMKL